MRLTNTQQGFAKKEKIGHVRMSIEMEDERVTGTSECRIFREEELMRRIHFMIEKGQGDGHWGIRGSRIGG